MSDKSSSNKTNKTKKVARTSKFESQKNACLPLLLKGHTVAEIQEFLKLPNPRVIYNWIKSEGWESLIKASADAEQTASRRLCLLIEKENKTKADNREMVAISEVLLNLEKKSLLSKGKSFHGNVGNGNGGRAAAKSKKAKKNDICHLTQADFDKVFKEHFARYGHQKKWHDSVKDDKTKWDRFILKSRQIGATYYFAFEAFESACMDGENQIFLSATRDQAEIFKAYMYAIVKEFFDIELSGNPTLLSNGATCFYLSNNSTSAQSRPGNVYFDEVFWVKDWDKMLSLGGAMATQKFKITRFSTPSAISHPAYKHWNGKYFNNERPESEKVKINLRRSDLKKGVLGGDGMWRNLVTIQDAIDQGFDRVDLELIKRRNPPSVFKNLYECHFVNDADSVFKLDEILACAVNTDTWKGYKPNDDYPWGTNACTSGLDPAGGGDNSCAIVMSWPDSLKDKFRLFETQMIDGSSGSSQGEFINEWNDTKYNIQYCGVNTDGMGHYVDEFIDKSIDVERLDYTPELKQQFIAKTKELLRQKRFEYPDNNKTLPLAFLTIVQTMTEKSRKLTYVSSRSDEVGHGDEAWAVMQGFMCEPVDIGYGEQSSLSIGH